MLVDRNGAGITAKQICARIWADDGSDNKYLNYLHQLFADLRSALKEAGAEAVLQQNGHSYALDTERIDCDYYRFLKSGRPEFHGEYMAGYSWAEDTCGLLWQQ